jgi:hypothetical protein
VPVCAARGNVEIAWKHCTRQTNDNLVAYFKIASAAHDTANVLAAIGSLLTFSGHANLTPANGLAVALRLWDELEDLTDNNRAGDTESVGAFFFETDLDQLSHHAFRRDVSG